MGRRLAAASSNLDGAGAAFAEAGEPGALLALLTICFSYGFFHAVGPGHGKVLIGGYSLASKATMWRMSSVALLSSLAQGLSAIVLVFAGVLVLNLTRQQMVGLAEDWFADASYAAIALIGLYLLLRGARKLLRVTHGEAHAHNHHDGHIHCHDCGHAHAPGLHDVEAAGELARAGGPNCRRRHSSLHGVRYSFWC